MQKNILKTFLQDIPVVLCKKTARKNSYYSKNETILKIGINGNQAKALAFAKRSLWIKKVKKHAKAFLQDIPVVLCKKQLEKRINIRKMRPF